ncbi:MAG: alpha-2-macroglobulin family protein, partial [Cocleimonas sp.]
DASLDRVQVSLYKVHWKWWWDKSADSLAQYADSKHKQLLQQDVVNTTDGTGEWKFQIKYPQWGRYLVRACDLEGNHCTGKTVYIDWPGWAGRAQEEGSGAASRLNLFSDKPAYNVGETATIQLPAAAQGRALLTVETGSQILEQRWVDFEAVVKKEGEESRVQFKLDITEKMTPNVYVHMTLLQPHEGKSNDRPIRLYGIIPIEVSNPQSYLKPKLEASNEWQPESKQTVKVSEANGQEMNYTIAVVDEGLLGLTSFKTPNLHRYFYRKEALGIKTWDMFDDVVGAYGGKLERMLALGGGDGEENEDDDSKKRRFPPVVKYMGPFNLKAGASAEHEVELPPYLGAVRVMVVAGNMLNDTAAYGKAQQSIFVRQPLMMQTSLPRVLGPDEEVAVPVSLFVMEAAIKEVKVSLETDDLVSLVGETVQKVSIDKVGEKTVFIKIKTGIKSGKAELKFTATAGVNGEHSSTKTVYLDIRRANQETTRTITKVIEPNASWVNKAEAFGLAGTNQAVLELSSVPSLNLKKRLDYLTRYPHGCLEQTTSAVFPQLYLSKVMELSEKQQKESEHHVRRAIDKLQSFQNGSGNFSYWPGGGANTSNAWASIYAGHFLLEAQKLGYVIPSTLLRKWLNHQSKTAQQYVAGNSRYSHIQAYRLYVLALAGKPQLGAMNRLREAANVGDEQTSNNLVLNNKARWLLASAYQAASQPAAAQALIQGMSLDVADVERSDRTFSSTLGDLGLRLESLVALNKKQDANKIIEQIAAEMSSDEYQNTQGIAWALMGVSRYLGGDTSSFSAKLSENGSATEINSKKSFTSTRLVKADSEITLENTSGVKLFANLVNSGVPVAGKERTQNKGLTMNVYYASRESGEKAVWNKIADDDPEWKVIQGKDVLIGIDIKNNSNHSIENIALTIPAAAGLEILSATEQAAGIKREYDHRDLRDDRIHYYFDLKKGKSKSFQLLANASYQGRYYQPAISAEAMYDGNIKATKKGRWLDIVKTLANEKVKQEPIKEQMGMEAKAADAQ